jgi:peptide/nickel transport system substrate-binding protein
MQDSVSRALKRFRPMSRRTFLRGLLGLGLAGPLSGCTPATAPAEPTPAGPRGQLTVAMPFRVVALDPHGAQGVERPTLTVARHIFDTLVVRDPATGEYRPALAVEWSTPDQNTWVFTLRPGVRYHDGSPLTSADVKACIERVVALKGPPAPLWAALEGVETPDERTVRIRTRTPVGTMLANLALLYIAPASRVNAEGFFNSPVGTGPFKFVSWRRDAEVRLEANPDHWGGPPAVKTLVFKDIPEVAARVTALETGEVDLTYGLPPDQLPALRRNRELELASVPSYTYYFVWFNHQRPPFNDVRVRKALWHALDIEAMARDLLKEVGRSARAPIPETVFGFAPQTPYEYNPGRARQLLREAGLPEGFETTMQWNPGSGPQDREVAQAMISYWNAVGVRVKSLEKERAQWLKDLLELNWDLNFQTNSVQTGDADFTLRRLYHSSARRLGYANPTLDRLLDEAAATLDQRRRLDLYAQAQQILWEDAVGIFPFDLLEVYVFRKRVSNFAPEPSGVPGFHRVRVVG